MSSKEHCHGCGKLWSQESPDCVFNYHKKPEPQLTDSTKENEPTFTPSDNDGDIL